MKKKKFEVLVIDDDPADVDLIQEALNLVGNRPFEIILDSVEDGEKALAYLHEKRNSKAAHPDLIILDLNMPRKSGYEVLKEIKGSEEFKSIPVVVLTTSSAQEDVKKSYRLGANSFITKAKDFADFARIVQTIEDFWLKVATLPLS
jgi:two-component system response regulator